MLATNQTGVHTHAEGKVSLAVRSERRQVNSIGADSEVVADQAGAIASETRAPVWISSRVSRAQELCES